LASAFAVWGCNGSSDSSGNTGGTSASARGTASPSSTARTGGSAASADDQAAADFIQGKIEEKWVRTTDGWTTQLQRRNMFGEPMEGVPEVLYLQHREMKFNVSPVTLTESQKLNGATYRAEVTFEYVPTRRFHTEKSMAAPPGWSPWDDEQPAGTIAVERRNGKWLTEDLEMFAGRKPDASAIPTGQ
jgi:hypothetical protein